MSTSITVSTPLNQISDVKTLLRSQEAFGRLSSVASRYLNPEVMMRTVSNAIRQSPALQKADTLSFMGAMMTSAQLGFIPNTPLGHAYLVPFWSSARKCYEVQLIVGYKGYIDLAYRSGKVVSVRGGVVRDDDEVWEYSYGTGERLIHKPGPGKGEIIAAYCYAKLHQDGLPVPGETFEVLSMEQVYEARSRSQGYRKAVKDGKGADHPWEMFFPLMARKTAVRFTANRGELPMSIEYIQAAQVDEKLVDYAALVDDSDVIEHDPDAEETTKEPVKATDEPAPRKRGRPRKTENTPVKPALTWAGGVVSQEGTVGFGVDTAETVAAPAPEEAGMEIMVNEIAALITEAASVRDLDDIARMEGEAFDRINRWNSDRYAYLMSLMKEARDGLK